MNEQNKTEEDTAQNSANKTRRVWTDPVISRIAIKRTLVGSGSGFDMSGQISS